MERPQNPPIVRGRLYGFKGAVVRACDPVPNGKRWVSFHKYLTGVVNEQELTWLERAEVQKYLATK